jgi:hypothetical protein
VVQTSFKSEANSVGTFFGIVFAVIAVAFVVLVILAMIGNQWKQNAERERVAGMTPAERQAHMRAKQQEKERRTHETKRIERDVSDMFTHGTVSPQMLCPHCQMRGAVRTRQVAQKKGLSGGKATAAVVTLGWSMLVTGLSRKERNTRAHCGNCQSTWHF